MIHPVAMIIARHRVRKGLHAAGADFVDAMHASRGVTAEDLTDTASGARIVLPSAIMLSEETAAGGLEALGDGTIIKAIIAFFESPMGQALIKILVAALLAAMGL